MSWCPNVSAGRASSARGSSWSGSLVGWPVSVFTWARDEPRFVLSLSWLAIVVEAANLLTSSQVHEEQGEGETSD